MKITAITTTCDRPFGVALMERYIARQTAQPDEWIVADGGQTQAALTMGQTHIHVPAAPGFANFANNILRALEAATGDVIVVVEDDDWYSPNHIEQSVRYLASHKATGSRTLRYFNVEHRCWIKMHNIGAALCQTAFRSELIPAMQSAARAALRCGDFQIDGRFWRSAPHDGLHDLMTVIGIKGLPGTAGLGIGHRPNTSARRRWRPDPGFAQLREWTGDDADNYTTCSSRLDMPR